METEPAIPASDGAHDAEQAATMEAIVRKAVSYLHLEREDPDRTYTPVLVQMLDLLPQAADAHVEAMFNAMTTEDRVRLGILARETKKAAETALKSTLSILDRIQKGAETSVLGDMNVNNQDNISGAGWRATKTTRTNASLSDAQAFYEELQKNGRYDLLQRRLSSKAIEAYVEEHGDTPAGVNLFSELVVTFYRK